MFADFVGVPGHIFQEATNVVTPYILFRVRHAGYSMIISHIFFTIPVQSMKFTFSAHDFRDCAVDKTEVQLGLTPGEQSYQVKNNS